VNAPPLSASPPPLPRPKAHRWAWVAAAGACVVIVFALVWQARFPSEEERKYFGWWYGSETIDEDNARSWIAEFAGDGELRIQFRHYRRAGSREPWVTKDNREDGHWRVHDGVQRLTSHDPARKEGWLEKADRFQRTGHWQRVHFYRTTEINDREMRYEAMVFGTHYHALRSPRPLAFPAEPLPPEKWHRTATP
jgi:hypothetical protein